VGARLCDTLPVPPELTEAQQLRAECCSALPCVLLLSVCLWHGL
jgi:hypothetical protein